MLDYDKVHAWLEEQPNMMNVSCLACGYNYGIHVGWDCPLHGSNSLFIPKGYHSPANNHYDEICSICSFRKGEHYGRNFCHGQRIEIEEDQNDRKGYVSKGWLWKQKDFELVDTSNDPNAAFIMRKI